MLFTSRKSLLGRAGIAMAVLLVLGLATEAVAARKASATGFYRLGRGQVNLPMQFVLGGSMHNIPLGFPNDDAMINGDITLSGKAPANIIAPQSGLIMGGYSALLPLMGTNNVQITSMFTMFTAPGATGGLVFNSMNGPGPFSFCPGTVPGTPGAACPVSGTMTVLSLPPQGTGTRNGRLIYLGGSGFGGVSQVFLDGGGLVTRPAQGFGFGSPIFQAAHEIFGGGGGGLQAIGGPYGFTDPNMLNGAIYTQPKTAPTTVGTISGAQAGPYVTTMNALTSCPSTTMGGAYPNIPLTGTAACVTATTMAPLKTGGIGNTFNTGFPFTTGTVLAQQTTNTAAGADLFTVAGSDARTSRGIGNITLVAGGLAERTNNSNPTGAAGGSVDTISMTISEKAPSMSGAGFAAAALLMVLGTGYAMRRRF